MPKCCGPIDGLLAGHGWLAPEAFADDFAELGSAQGVVPGQVHGDSSRSTCVAGALRDRRGRRLQGRTREATTCGMAKVKTDAYLARLKAAFADRWEEHWE